MKKLLFVSTLIVGLALATFGQKLVSPVIGQYRLSDADLIKLVKAEDARDAAPAIAMFTNVNTATRYRAALAAGRIGDEKAVDGLVTLMADGSVDVRAMAAFAIGEIESVKGADAVLNLLKSPKLPDAVRARAVEAAGKIAAAHAKDPKAKDLGEAIITTLNAEADNPTEQNRGVILLAITAALRARPERTGETVARFLTHDDPRIRADACNTIARVRAKNANATLRTMLLSDSDAGARANAARALGAAEDKEATDVLQQAAVGDDDPRVRVSAIRALGNLKDAKSATYLIAYGEAVLLKAKREGVRRGRPVNLNELLEIVTASSRLLQNAEDKRAIKLLADMRVFDKYRSPETEIAFARIAPKAYLNLLPPTLAYREWRVVSAWGQGLAEISATKDVTLMAQAGEKLTSFIATIATGVRPADQTKMLKAMPDLTGAIATLKPDNLEEILLGQLKNADVFIRAAAAGAIADQPATKDSVSALNNAFTRATVTDKHGNDAQLAILDALVKLDKKAGVGSYSIALASPDYLVRKKAFEILADKELESAYPGMTATVASERKNHKDQVLPYQSVFGTKLGQVLNSDIDYRRALSRRNGSVKAVLMTEKGEFTIVFYPEDAPLTVDNWVKLARSGYFNGLEVHRVVPNFVMQDGDPRGDGNGGPGWSIRCEVNTRGYDRGAVGMALSGKDTGGSQWFVTHAPQPHLDGGYTVFGHVSEADMTVVDKIVRGDKILKVTIVGK